MCGGHESFYVRADSDELCVKQLCCCNQSLRLTALQRCTSGSFHINVMLQLSRISAQLMAITVAQAEQEDAIQPGTRSTIYNTQISVSKSVPGTNAASRISA